MVEVNTEVAITLQAPKATLGDIYKWLKQVELFNLPEDHPVDDLTLAIYINIPQDTIEEIYCAACSPKHQVTDVMITTHQCTNKSIDE